MYWIILYHVVEGEEQKRTVKEQTIFILQDPSSSYRLPFTEMSQVSRDIVRVAAVVSQVSRDKVRVAAVVPT